MISIWFVVRLVSIGIGSSFGAPLVIVDSCFHVSVELLRPIMNIIGYAAAAKLQTAEVRMAEHFTRQFLDKSGGMN